MELVESFNEYFNEYKNARAYDRRSARTATAVETATTARMHTASRVVVETMKRYAILNRGSEAKEFTDAIYNLDRDSMAAILRGLFTADGTVANYAEKSQYVSLDSCSLGLLQQVQLFLLQFGIKAKIYEDLAPEHVDYNFD
jgi:ribonucleoside-diphosphate reductase alpha chain